MKTLLFVSTLLTAASLVLGGCATRTGPNLCELRDANTGQVVPANFAGTTGSLATQKELESSVTLQSVETTACAGFDRVVFQFNTPATPGYRAAYVAKPIRNCGSGDAVTVAGSAWIEVRFHQTRAHTEAGQATIAQTNRAVTGTNLRQLVQTCDFENDVTWVLGVGSKNRYRIVELTNPSRLIVDIKR